MSSPCSPNHLHEQEVAESSVRNDPGLEPATSVDQRPTGVRSAIGAIALCLVVAAALTGCATTTTGIATRTTSGRPAVRQLAIPHAPKVVRPLDPSAMVSAPCTSLTTTELVTLDVTRPISVAHSATAGTRCTWTGDSGGSVGVSWISADSNGLSDLYAQQSIYGYWQPTSVAGYPAVYGDPLGDQRPHGECVLNVGANDHLLFFVQYERPLEPAKGCPLAASAAADVIANLKATA